MNQGTRVFVLLHTVPHTPKIDRGGSHPNQTSTMNYLIDCIEEYRDYKGVYSEHSRREFVERFLVLRGGQWEERDYHRDAVVEWATESLDWCVRGTKAGEMLRESILSEVRDDACERLLSAIRDVADDIELTEEEEKENDDD